MQVVLGLWISLTSERKSGGTVWASKGGRPIPHAALTCAVTLPVCAGTDWDTGHGGSAARRARGAAGPGSAHGAPRGRVPVLWAPEAKRHNHTAAQDGAASALSWDGGPAARPLPPLWPTQPPAGPGRLRGCCLSGLLSWIFTDFPILTVSPAEKTLKKK